jgi:glucosamine-6-phosphate deaminase
MQIEIRPDYTGVCREVAARIAQIIREKPNAVFGLATGSTPLGVYEELIRLHREEGLSFAQVRTFNLDEYYPMAPDAPQSYVRFMREKLFDHIDIAPENWHVPSGVVRSSEEVEADCARYEQQIQDAGGLDFQLLGIGRTGHIGFNEPGSATDSRTRLVVLDHLTRTDAAGDFFGMENVPARAITMGVGTVLDAREIALLASGTRKAAIVAEALEGKITSKVPASFLREHLGATFWLDENAAAELESARQGWRAPQSDFSQFETRRRAVLGIAQQAQKPIAELTLADAASAGAGQLAASETEFDTLKSEVEADLKRRMDDELLPRGKTILCLSPHPDDDVIGPGATITRLASLGNTVYVAYGVSGANAVRDKDVLALLRARHSRLVSYLESVTAPGKSLESAMEEVRTLVYEREPGAPDAPLLRELKRLVREGEASDGCRKMGATPIFWKLPFYGDGAHRLPVGDDDIQIVLATLASVQPDIVMLTGEHNDPHGTHELCAQAFERAASVSLQTGGKEFRRWFYRGAWDEWPLEEGDYFCVFGKKEMDAKISLILDHISQLDPLFGGDDAREFWERARDRNRQSARELQALGVLPPSRSFDPLYVEVVKFEPQAEE